MASVPTERHGLPANVMGVTDDILAAFEYACDLRELAIAQRLLETVEAILARRGGGTDGSDGSRRALIADAYARLVDLQRADGG